MKPISNLLQMTPSRKSLEEAFQSLQAANSFEEDRDIRSFLEEALETIKSSGSVNE